MVLGAEKLAFLYGCIHVLTGHCLVKRTVDGYRSSSKIIKNQSSLIFAND